nr:aspartic proteinase-like protein 2 [Quercus suber]
MFVVVHIGPFKTRLLFIKSINQELEPHRQYSAKLGLGSPPKDYYVQVDIGSDILWVNCVGCKSCPKKSSLGGTT